MNKKLLRDQILLKIENIEEKTASGLILNKRNEPGATKTGEVVQIGKGKTEYGVFVPMDEDIKVGGSVLFWGGEKIMFEGEWFILVNEPNIIMVL
jgi:co-chaperonin GroES (HSP10)